MSQGIDEVKGCEDAGKINRGKDRAKQSDGPVKEAEDADGRSEKCMKREMYRGKYGTVGDAKGQRTTQVGPKRNAITKAWSDLEGANNTGTSPRVLFRRRYTRCTRNGRRGSGHSTRGAVAADMYGSEKSDTGVVDEESRTEKLMKRTTKAHSGRRRLQLESQRTNVRMHGTRERGSSGGIRKTRLGASTAKNLKRNGGGNGAASEQGRPRAIVDEVVYRTQEGVMSGWCTERQCASQTWKRVAGKNNVCGLGVAVGRAVDMNGEREATAGNGKRAHVDAVLEKKRKDRKRAKERALEGAMAGKDARGVKATAKARGRRMRMNAKRAAVTRESEAYTGCGGEGNNRISDAVAGRGRARALWREQAHARRERADTVAGAGAGVQGRRGGGGSERAGTPWRRRERACWDAVVGACRDAVAGTGALRRRSKGGSGRSGTPWRGRAGAVAMSDTVAGASTHGCCGGGERARALRLERNAAQQGGSSAISMKRGVRRRFRAQIREVPYEYHFAADIGGGTARPGNEKIHWSMTSGTVLECSRKRNKN
ncbi:hypothetical protein C8J57DRAFT_1462312 [Mycena rebaudengoi]|nr:hypothetical protein C8J57DRAFT_1462312 [Mycena rebaudengoi]